MAQQGKGSGFWTVIKIFLIIILIVLLVLGIYLFAKVMSKGWDATFSPKNQTGTNTTIVNYTTQQIQQGVPNWVFIGETLLLAAVFVALIALLLRRNLLNSINFKARAEEMMHVLLEQGYPFIYEYDGEEREINASLLKKKQKLGATAYLLPGSIPYFYRGDIRFKRYLFRFWKYSKRSRALLHKDYEPPGEEVYVGTVSAYGIFWDRPEFLAPMTARECIKYVHEQQYGLIPPSEAVEAQDIIAVRMQKNLQEEANKTLTSAIAHEAAEHV